MLNFIYYPVSAILWFWHKVFGFVLGPANGIAWALSVIFLVFTLRVLLFKPFVNQVKTQRQMQEFQPQIKALQKKYSGDKQKLAVEMQKLQKENGFNPISGCLPVLAQAPVFIGLYHVLRSFNRTTHGVGQLGLSVTENRTIPNYVFDVADVNSFLNAKLFGAPLSSSIRSSSDQLLAFGTDISKASIIGVAVPLMVIAAIATHFTARASVARQAANPTAAAAPQAAIMNKLVVWVFPFFVLFGGPFLPIAILLYWLANNGWTLAQQHYVFGKLAKEEEAKKAQTQERRTASAPRPGAKPTTMTKTRKPPQEKVAPGSEDGVREPTSGAVEDTVSLSKDDAEGVQRESSGSASPTGGTRNPGPGSKRGTGGARRQGPGGPPRKSAPGARGGPSGGKRGSTPGNSPRKKR